MATHPIRANNSSTRRAAPAPTSSAERLEAGKEAQLPNVIHLGIDVHLRQHVVRRKIDAATVQPAQRMKPEEFVAMWVVECGFVV
ncbi:MAG: hypothetical protein Q8M07_11865 [Prosthecobacter sp.]|nr:hypothetical protein [Prosthecobacter sp.]